MFKYFVPIKEDRNGNLQIDMNDARENVGVYSTRNLVVACIFFGGAFMAHQLGYGAASTALAIVGAPFAITFGSLARLLVD